MATTSGDSSFVFTEDEVQEELKRLGITNIDKASLQQFRHELQDLIQEVSASSTGFPDHSSSSSTSVVGGRINNSRTPPERTCSDMSTPSSSTSTVTQEEGKTVHRSSQSSSRSSLSIPSPLLTPPLGKNYSDVPMALYRNPPGGHGPEKSNSGHGRGQINSWRVPTGSQPPPPTMMKNHQIERPDQSISSAGHIRTAWDDPTVKDPTDYPPPLVRKNPEFGRTRDFNSGSNHHQSNVGSSSMDTQRQGNISNFNNGIYTRQQQEEASPNYPPSNVGSSTSIDIQRQESISLFNDIYTEHHQQQQQQDASPDYPTLQNMTGFEKIYSQQQDASSISPPLLNKAGFGNVGFSDQNEVFKSTDTTDHRLRDKENIATTSYDTRTRPFTSLLQQPLPHETNKGGSVLGDFETLNGNNGFLEELLRVCNNNPDNNSDHNSPPENGTGVVVPPAKKFTKRKIVRKDAEGKSYVDESYTESDSGSLLDPVEYMERLREMNKSIYDIAGERRSSSSCDFYPSSRAPFSVTDNRPKSVILAPTTPPKLKKNKKSDPVNRYHQFRDYWAHHKVPGENRHNELRWFIKERMSHQDQIEIRPRKVYVPNNYVPPTEKHRNALRWQIRTDLAYGFMPSSRDGNNY